MTDKIQKIDSSTIQHGKLNDRIYLMHVAEADISHIVPKLLQLAQEHGYSKIFAKVPSKATPYFQKYDFFKEAYVPGFYHGKDGMYCLSKFLQPDRSEIPLNDRLEIWKIIQLTKTKQKESKPEDADHVRLRELLPADAEPLTALYKAVFKTYPFPIFDIEYIQKTMQDNVRYFGAFQGDELVGASSAEIFTAENNAEMTDFAVLPDYRSKNIALHLLLKMEHFARMLDIRMLYTIARALSPGMNITFAKAGYYFGGTLKNNTNINGTIESMNVWYKPI